MLTSAGDLPPFNTDGLPNANDAHVWADAQLFLAGDVRANENPGLASLHTLFIREHNRLAGLVAAAEPSASDEVVFQHARRGVIALLQQITYKEFLPAIVRTVCLLSPAALKHAKSRTVVKTSIFMMATGEVWQRCLSRPHVRIATHANP